MLYSMIWLRKAFKLQREHSIIKEDPTNSDERGKAGGHEPPLFPLPCHILAFFSSGSHEPCGGTEGEIVVAHGRMPSPARQNLLDLLLLLNVPSAA